MTTKRDRPVRNPIHREIRANYRIDRYRRDSDGDPGSMVHMRDRLMRLMLRVPTRMRVQRCDRLFRMVATLRVLRLLLNMRVHAQRRNRDKHRQGPNPGGKA
jgi:hypothetical protein